MDKKLFWGSMVFAIIGWTMYGIDKWVTSLPTDISQIGMLVGVLGLFGIMVAFTS